MGRGEARPWGIVRVWTPAWNDRPTVETLHKALEAKYAAPSWMQTLGGGYGVRLVWSFDPAGEPLGAQDAERCSSAFVGRRPLGALHLASLDYRGSALPDLEFVTREGCGVQLVVSHPNVTRPIDPVAPVVFAIYDPQSALVTRWTRQLERMAADMSYARQSIDQAAAERAERDGRQPDL
ncbi:MAG: hypothetical protein H5U17_17340 [Defluviimonas sp.]|nr:hypothetical protein [Defluviimonas sp.]